MLKDENKMDLTIIDVDAEVDKLKLQRRNTQAKGDGVKSSYLRRVKLKTEVLNKQKMDYVLKVGGSTYQLDSILFKDKAFNSTNLANKDLLFIKKVKRHILKNKIYLNFLDQYFPSDVAYVDVNPTLHNRKITNVKEVDVDEAYWKTAYLLGAIDEELYEEGKKGNLGKYTRLVALGALAKKETHYIYKNGVYSHKEEIRSELTENVWYSICKRFSDVMQGAKQLLGNDYLFYWVDGIYFVNNKTNNAKLTRYFLKHGYSTKEVETFMVGFGEKWFAVYDKDLKIKKEFTYSGIINRKISFEDSRKLNLLCREMMKGNLDITTLISNKNKPK